MLQRFWRNIVRFWPIGFLILLEFIIAATNYKPGTYLMGWDNVMPEFNFPQALCTNIMGVWQSYRGVGVPDGMGHAANLVHTLFLWLLSLALPQSLLRYTFHFLMHLTGMIGMYILLNGSLTGALFYGLNLITIQMFYTPLEAFSVHFAALPWLAYGMLSYLKKPSRTTLLLFICISILSTPQFFIPTLLLPIILLMTSIALLHRTQKKQIIIACCTFLCVNAFWLLPYLYNLPHNAPIIAGAKINQMSSLDAYERNRVFGTLQDVLTFKGFMLNFEDTTRDGKPIFVMNVWRTWVQHPGVRTLGFLFAGLMIIGLWKSSWASLIWFFSGMMLLNNTPYLATIMNVLRDHIPFFSEAYRFPFTKLGLLFGFSSTILVTQAIRLIKPGFARLVKLLCVGAIFLSSLPLFRGYFFYDALRVSLPYEYIKLFNYMDTLDHSGRTVYMPQPSYWSWKHYNFGYVGSGFLWHGMPQPLMDRAFDPWSNGNENFYWEVSYALYSKNADRLHAVFQKYDISYIIFDSSVISPGNNRALLPEETKQLLSSIPSITHLRDIDSLSVYAATDTSLSSHLANKKNLPVGPSYTWTDNDTFFQEFGTYVVEKTLSSQPLFTKRAISEYTMNIPTANPIYSTDGTDVLDPQAVKPCGVLKTGKIDATRINDYLRIVTESHRGCISFSIPTLKHRSAYQVTVTSRNISGKPLLFSLINDTDKHVEIEVLISHNDHSWHTDSFYLPPLAPDGLGYTVYMTNDNVGTTETINDIQRINIYPYTSEIPVTSVTKPSQTNTLIASTAYHPGWIAIDTTTWKLLPHVLINNWKNGWTTPSTDISHIIIIFWPQVLEYIGFLLIPVSLIFFL